MLEWAWDEGCDVFHWDPVKSLFQVPAFGAANISSVDTFGSLSMENRKNGSL